jgi:hypothetical protein
LLSGTSTSNRALPFVTSHFRLELTALSYKLEKLGSPIAAQLKLCTTNKERSRTIASEITKGTTLKFSDASDDAALARMTTLMSDPASRLTDVKNHAAVAFRRLYRNRNLVLHWGKTDAVALDASLRTTAPIVGAGMDRIVHAFFVDNVQPLELAATASINLAAVGSTYGPSIVDLLG